MVRRKNDIGPLGIQVSAAVRGESATRRQSGRVLAEIIGKSEAYVSLRLRDEKEWTITDIGKLCDAWHITPQEFMKQAQNITIRDIT